MPLFESPIVAWHDAFTTVEGFQDPYTPKPPKGTSPGNFREVRMAELAKVRKAVMALPEERRHAGMWAFGPENEDTFRARNKLRQRAWEHLLAHGPEKAYRNYEKNYRMAIMVVAVLEEARARANGNEKSTSEMVVANTMGIDRSSFSRTWAPVYRELVEILRGEALLAVTAIDPLVQDINRRYRWAS